MTAVELIILALATWEIVEIWMHGSIFATSRARVQLKHGFVARLLQCGFCMAPWVAWLLYLLYGAGWVYRFLISGFAIARLANLGNDLTHHWCRTPKEHLELPDIDITDETGIDDGAGSSDTSGRSTTNL